MADAPQLFRLLGGRRCRGNARHLLPIPCVWRRRSVVDHCDPYGTAMTLRPDGRSIVWGAPTCQWTDSAWMAKRSKNFDAPLNIYEAQAGSWRCKEDGTPYTYSELAKQLPAT